MHISFLGITNVSAHVIIFFVIIISHEHSGASKLRCSMECLVVHIMTQWHLKDINLVAKKH